jgi:transcriptional regulator with XRE-family HTH domain
MEQDLGIPQWTLADRLRKSLDHADVSSAEMAQYLEVHRNTISNWIYGHARPPASAVKLWAMRTGVPYTWLMGNGRSNGSHITALMRDQQPGYTEVRNDITAMRKALGHNQRRPSNRAEITERRS